MTSQAPAAPGPRRIGRYVLHDKLASGGMASVHVGRMVGAADFGRVVAIKRMHPHLAEEAQFVAMFLDEAKIAARIRHPNVVQMLDVVAEAGELFIVMEYVEGDSLARVLGVLADKNAVMPVEIAASIAIGMLSGLHAAHEATSEARKPLDVIHRDVSPHNVMIGADGVARVMDFGIAKALGRLHTTRDGALKGKLTYMSPEQLKGDKLDRRSDIWAASVVLWEMLAGRRLFQGNEASVVYDVLDGEIQRPSVFNPAAARLDAIVMKGLSRPVEDRFDSALQMVERLEEAAPVASTRQVSQWLDGFLSETLQQRAALIAEIETTDPDAPPVTGRRGQETTPSEDRDSATVPQGRSRASRPAALQPARSLRVPLLFAIPIAIAGLSALVWWMGSRKQPGERVSPSATPAASASPTAAARGTALRARSLAVELAFEQQPLAIRDDRGLLVGATLVGQSADFGNGRLPDHADLSIGIARLTEEGTAIASTHSKGNAPANLHGLASGPSGVVITGVYNAGPRTHRAFDIGCGPLTGAANIFLARLNSDLTCAWSLGLGGDDSTETGNAVDVDGPSKTIAFAGEAGGLFMWGQMPVGTGTHVLIAALLDEHGMPLWLQSYARSSPDIHANAVAFTGPGEFLMAVDEMTAGGDSNAMVFLAREAKLAQVRTYAEPGVQSIAALAARGGRVLIGGRFESSIQLDADRALHGSGSGDSDGFVAVYNATMASSLLAIQIAGPGGAKVSSVAWDDAGFYAAGTAIGLQTVGTTSFGSGASEDAFVIKFDDNGNVLWARSFTALDAQTGAAVVPFTDSVGLVGIVRSTVDFDGHPVTGSAAGQPFFAQLGK